MGKAKRGRKERRKVREVRAMQEMLEHHQILRESRITCIKGILNKYPWVIKFLPEDLAKMVRSLMGE